MPRGKKKTAEAIVVEPETAGVITEVGEAIEASELETTVINEEETKTVETTEATPSVSNSDSNIKVSEPENVTLTYDEEGNVIGAQTTQELIDQENAEAPEGSLTDEQLAEQAETKPVETPETTIEPLNPTAANRGITSQIITNPFGGRSVGYQPNPSRAVFSKADKAGHASVTVFGRRGEERIKHGSSDL